MNTLAKLWQLKPVRYATAAMGGLFFFALSVYWMFPYDQVRDLVVYEIEHPRGPGNKRGRRDMSVSIESLRPSWFTGVVMKGVELRRTAASKEERFAPGRFEEIVARISPLSLLASGTSLTITAVVDQDGGELEADLELQGEEVEVEAELRNFNLAGSGVPGVLLGIPFRGRANGEVELKLSQGRENSRLDANITVDKLTAGNGNAKLKLPGLGIGMAIERVNAGRFQLTMKTENNAARITKCTTNGRDLKLFASGQVRFMDEPSISRVNVLMRLEFSDEFQKRGERNRALFSDAVPVFKSARTQDKAIQYRLTGTVKNLRAIPAGRSPRPMIR